MKKVESSRVGYEFNAKEIAHILFIYLKQNVEEVKDLDSCDANVPTDFKITLSWAQENGKPLDRYLAPKPVPLDLAGVEAYDLQKHSSFNKNDVGV